METTKVHSAYELLANQFGLALDFEENPVVSSVGVTDLVLVKNNPRRIALVIINLSGNTLYVRPGSSPASATAGMVLVSGGGSLTMDVTSDFILPAREWHAVATGAASAVYVMGVFIV